MELKKSTQTGLQGSTPNRRLDHPSAIAPHDLIIAVLSMTTRASHHELLMRNEWKSPSPHVHMAVYCSHPSFKIQWGTCETGLSITTVQNMA